MTWEVVDGPFDYDAGPDAVMAWEWTIERSGERRTIRIELSRDAAEAEAVDEASWMAASLRGRSAFASFLDDENPPDQFVIRADGVHRT